MQLLIVVMSSVVMLSVVAQSVIMLSVLMLISYVECTECCYAE